MISIHLNGEEKKLPHPVSLQELISQIETPSAIAVAVNLEVIPRSEFKKVEIRDKDRVEIIRPVGGG